jgi:phosphoglycerate dehydrogenase-like enzyme
MNNKLLVLSRDQTEIETKLRARNLPDLDIYAPQTEAEILKLLPEVNIFLANPPIAQNYINQAKKLVWMQSIFAGIDLMLQTNLRKDYILTNVKNVYGQIMAEYVLAYILFFEKKIHENIKWQKQNKWNQFPYHSVAGRTIGIMGTGSIGQEIALASKNLGLRVIGFRNDKAPVPHFDQIFTQVDLNKFLEISDYIICVLPDTPNTKKMINLSVFKTMKPSAVFINIGRGNTVCEKSLIEALSNSVIKAAVLDVFEKEPVPEDSELWNTPNLYMTPHVSGYVINDAIFDIFENNYQRFLKNEKLEYQVDFLKGY